MTSTPQKHTNYRDKKRANITNLRAYTTNTIWESELEPQTENH